MFDDPRAGLPPEFDDGGRNPCWTGRAAGPHRQHCLPSFLIVGVYQSGVRDLYSRLALHPEVARRPASSPSYYSQVKPDWPGYVRELDAYAAEAGEGKLLGEASAVTFHFVWVHQEKFNQPYVEAMGRYWRACNARTESEKAQLPHRECMRTRMPDAREADAAKAREAGMPFAPDRGATAQERTFSVPQLARAAYGEWPVRLILLLRKPWDRMHAAFYNYVHYRGRFGASAAGEKAWAEESVAAFGACAANFSVDACALSFESLSRENEEVFYHCDQLIKGLYSVFLPRWRREFGRMLLLRAEEYFASPQALLRFTFSFLGLAQPRSPAEWAPILDAPRQLAGSRPEGGAPRMLEATAALLRRFYTPSLSALCSMLAEEADAEEWRAWAGVVE